MTEIFARFETHLLLWLLALLVSGLVLWLYWRFRDKESRLPQACALSDLEARTASRRDDLAELETRLGAARDLIAESEKEQARLRMAQEWFQQNSEQLLSLKAEREQQELLRQQLAVLQEEVNRSGAQVKELDLQRMRLQADTERLQAEQKQAISKNNSLNEECMRLGEQVRELTRGVEDLKAQETQGQRTIYGIQERERQLKKECAEREEQVVRLLTEQREGEARIAGLKQELAELHRNAEADKQRYLSDKKLMEKGLETLDRTHQQTIKQIEEHWRRLEQHIERAVTAIQGTLEHVESRKDGTSPCGDLFKDLPIQSNAVLGEPNGKLGEAERLERTRDYIRRLGLEFPDRVLYAFHTALKVNDISPLVVLAGISGTGKSLLPLRYAEGMRFHFVSLTVQPRWDSPQDLFGFYNYLEHGYKATALSRALVQMERYNHSDWKAYLPTDWDPKIRERMLIVLLDEMNLARVEYYFSEFLSRLEMRRGIDRSRPEVRRMSEMALEMGALGQHTHEIRVFVDNNVLFVGTMNEDESTQSLSDKVLDRANVLRFGRPKPLVSSTPNHGEKPPSPPDSGPLLYAQWGRWLHKPEDLGHDMKKVEGWTEEINGSLAMIGRPFAHRVGQAILSYVANYPDVGGDNRVATAFADQVELRVMPKLRGLECGEIGTALSQIERVVDTLRDEALLKALKEGRRGQLFEWKGVDRSGERA